MTKRKRLKPKRLIALVTVLVLVFSTMSSGLGYAYDKDYTAYMVGNAHIDTAWKWLLEESAQECYTTFNRQIDNINNNPDFRFSTSASLHYKWTKEYFPELYNDIKDKVQAGQWEVVGGQVIEPDLNVPSGEALVRQFLYGQKFFKEEFGSNCEVGWVPDVFGFSGQTPQILKKSGLDYFITTKLNWNDTNTFPYEIFKWQGIDGTDVITYKPMKDYVHIYSDTDINNSLSKPDSLGIKKSMALYGAGDHGGGPVQSDIDQIKEQDADASMPSVKFKTAIDYFNDLTDTEKDALPVWTGEMYFEMHRGVYTTHGALKRYERKSEIAAEEAEKFSSIATWLGATSYPSDKIEKSWEKILINHMHDILPGSSWLPVYDEAWDDYEVALNQLNNVKDYAVEALASRANTTVESGVPVVIFNPLSWTRSDVIETEVVFPEIVTSVRIYDDTGALVPCQILSIEGNKAEIVFEANDIPSVGFKVFRVENTTKGSYDTGLSIGSNVVENDYIRVELSSNTGNFSRIYDKVNGKEVLQSGEEGNELHSYYDNPSYWSAWDLQKEQFTPSTSFDIINGLESITQIEAGPVKSTYRVVRDWSNSTFTQDITLYSNIDRVDIETVADWYESDKCLKVAFPINVDASNATYEIAYGAVERGNGYDEAQFEVSGHKWADLSEDTDYGVSILNDSKYGWDTIEANRLRLTLLRGPDTPQYNGADNGGPRADQGTHEYTYSVYPHSGDWKEANTQKEAFELNYPLTALQTTSHSGELGKEFSFVSVNKDNVIITAIKKAEESDDLIVRAYEAEGVDNTIAAINFADDIISVKETNLIEDEIDTLSATGDSFSATFGDYDIRSFKVNLQDDNYKNTKPTVTQVDLTGYFNVDGMSYDDDRSDGDLDGDGNTYSADLMPSTIVAKDVEFDIGSRADGSNNIVEADKQTIDLPEGSYKFLYLLGAGTSTNNEGEFTVNYADSSNSSKVMVFEDWKSEIGGWMKTLSNDEIGDYLTHYHTPSADEKVHDNYLFVYRIPLDQSKTVESITLPNSEGIKIAAMSLANGGFLAEPDIEAPSQVTGLTAVESGVRGVNLSWNASTDNIGVAGYRIYRSETSDFTPDGSNFIEAVSSVEYTDTLDAYSTYYYKVMAYDGEGNISEASEEVSVTGGATNIALNKTATASGNVAAEPPAAAVDGSVEDNSKWCATGSEPYWLQIDLGQSYDIVEFAVKHSEAGGESSSWNTRDFMIQVSDDETNWIDVVTVTGNTDEITTHTVADINARYTRLYITDAASDDNTAARIYEFEVYAKDEGGEPAPENLALNKTVAASGNVEAEPPEKAVDGIITDNSKWCATGTEPHWLKVDLGEKYQINEVVVQHAEAGGEEANFNTKDFTIQVSEDETNWTDAITVTGNDDAITTHTVSDVGGRYVRLYISDAANDDENTAARIYELEVYGQLYPDTEAPSQVTGVTADQSGIRQVELNWNVASDNVGVVGYKVYRSNASGFVPDDSSHIADTTVTNYTDTLSEYDTYYYKVAAYDKDGNIGEASDEISLTAGVSNVALNKTATASGNVASEPPEAAVDGEVENNSKWCATGSEPYWLEVDLGEKYEILEFAVKHAEAGGEQESWNTKDFTIQISDDATNWTDVVDVTGNTDGVTTHPVSNVNGRYIKLNVTDATNDGDTATRIYEFEAYGKPYTDTEAPSQVTDLSADRSGIREIDLSWNASSDNIGVDGYKIYRGTISELSTEDLTVMGEVYETNFTVIGEVYGTNYTDVLDEYDTYCYKIAAYDKEGNIGETSSEVLVDLEAINIALNKTATADKSIKKHTPELAVDGIVKKKSKWTAPGEKRHWLQLDLGESHAIDKFVVKHAEAGGEKAKLNTKDFKIQISDDGINWKDAVVVKDNNEAITVHPVEDINGRYVRLYIINGTNKGGKGVRIYEFEVYGY